MWNLYVEARTWRVRPSNLLGIRDTYVAYCLDSAVHEYGVWVENELQKITHKDPQLAERNRKARLKAILSGRSAAKQYADPADMFKKAKLIG